MIFAEGEEEKTIRAAVHWVNNGYGSAILVGREKKVQETFEALNLSEYLDGDKIKINNAAIDKRVDEYIEHLYAKLNRKGYLKRDVIRMVKNNRNTFSACMLELGEGDTLITGLVRGYAKSLEEVTLVADHNKEKTIFGVSMIMAKNKTLFVADTTVHEVPTAEELANMACTIAAKTKEFGYTPRVALVSYSTFGSPMLKHADRIRDAVKVLDSRNVDFEYDGEMSAEVALESEMMNNYPFCRLTGPANILIMPNLHASALSTEMIQQLSSATVIGPVLMGLDKAAQIIPMGSRVSEIVNSAALASI